MPPKYRKYWFLTECAQRKLGRGVFVVGADDSKVSEFIERTSYRPIRFDDPDEKGRAIVDISWKTHTNLAKKTDHDSEADADWFDGFEITSKKGMTEEKSKSYHIQLSSPQLKELSGDKNPNSSASALFNVVGSAKRSQDPETSEERNLSQEYQVIDSFKVPPQTRVKAKITTSVITYEAKFEAEYTTDASIGIPVRYRTWFSRCLGGLWTSNGILTAKDLFKGEKDYKCRDGKVTFKTSGTVSFLAEDVKIVKEKDQI